jgi:hypothetical protein
MKNRSHYWEITHEREQVKVEKASAVDVLYTRISIEFFKPVETTV